MKDEIISATGSTLTTVLGATTQDWIVFALGVVSGLITIAFTVWKWYRVAKADGKITSDEIKELIDDVSKDVKDTVDDINKNKQDLDK